jgi:hypothetical protein
MGDFNSIFGSTKTVSPRTSARLLCIPRPSLRPAAAHGFGQISPETATSYLRTHMTTGCVPLIRAFVPRRSFLGSAARPGKRRSEVTKEWAKALKQLTKPESSVCNEGVITFYVSSCIIISASPMSLSSNPVIATTGDGLWVNSLVSLRLSCGGARGGNAIRPQLGSSRNIMVVL